MRLSLLLALSIVSAALPAAAQPHLAEQCTGFGEAQYRRLDPSVEHITAIEFPVPVLERFDAKAGSQAVAAALTLRGRLSYRNRVALETQFVCLLDAANRPVFFYALPVLGSRPAPTPLARGGTAVPPPSPTLALAPRPVEPQRPAAVAAGAIQLRGLVRDLGGRLQFLPCDGAPLALEDRTPGQELSRVLRDLTQNQEGRPMFVEFHGQRESGAGLGVAALDLRRAAVETAGCRERFDQREWLASGNEPAWRLDITAKDLLMNVLSGVPGQREVHAGAHRDGGSVVYATVEGSEFRVKIDEQRCVDSSSGSLFAYRVEVQSEGKSLVGCAAHNPAMPAP
ncbi:MAG: hypothetical protein ACHQK9_00740 [Reyranellales bacterium]